MKLGFLTGCMGSLPLKEKAEWAQEHGLQAIEISCWPKRNDRDYSATDIDVTSFTKQDADQINEYLEEMKLTISSLAYYDNNLSADPAQRAFINNHLYRVIDAAALLGVDRVGTFVGKNHLLSVRENFDEFETVFTPIVAYAAEKNVKIMIENCPMVGWQIDGLPGTISFSPELWREMFRRIPHPNFGLNYDPSHLRFMLMDYITPLTEFKDRIFHVHAKDAKVQPDLLAQIGTLDRQLDPKPGTGYWTPVMPGLGDVNFKGLIDALKVIGYDDVISIEHEDAQYEGTVEKVQKGLEIAISHLSPLL